eukprot:767658-Hanusia_phi.AAC.3
MVREEPVKEEEEVKKRVGGACCDRELKSTAPSTSGKQAAIIQVFFSHRDRDTPAAGTHQSRQPRARIPTAVPLLPRVLKPTVTPDPAWH